MKIIGLDGKEHSWTPCNKQREKGRCSDLHAHAREILKEIYPYDSILEEVGLPGTTTNKNESELVADFFLPNRDLIVEVNGEQHSKYNTFFFKDKMSFYRAQKRDRDKHLWVNTNGFTLVVLEYHSKKDWKRIINERS